MKKRFALWLCFLTACLPLFAQQPNVLWVTIEDTSPQFIGCYGNKDARTPTIDSLASKGVRLTNAYSSSSVCSPSRFTIITGARTYEAGTGHHRSKYPVPDFMNGFPSYLRKQGYYTTNNYKTDYNTSAGQRITKQSWDENSQKATWENREPGQPFFAIFNYNECHQSRTMTFPYKRYKEEILDQLKPEERIGENDFEMPPFYRESPEMRKNLARVYNSLKFTDNLIRDLLFRLKEQNLTDSTIVVFYSDHGEGIPRGKTNGIGLGYKIPFIVSFPPMYQHLNPWGKATITDELVNFEDLAPTMLSLLGIEAPDYMHGRAIMGKLRKPAPDHIFASMDRTDENTDLVRSVIDNRFVYSRNYLPFRSAMRWVRYQEVSDIQKQIRKDFAEGKLNAAQRQILEPRPAEFLYDLQKDPWEMNNLAADPAYEKQLDKMRKLLDENLKRSRDILFMPEYEMAERSEKTAMYEYRQDETKYPFKDIYAAASLSGFRTEDVLKKQSALLSDKNNIVRYWAVTGMKSHGMEMLRPLNASLRKAMKDTYEPVRITAAALLAEMENDQAAIQMLNEYCHNENEYLALLAMQQISDMKNIAPFEEGIRFVSRNKKIEKGDVSIKSAANVLMYRLGGTEMNF